MPLCHGRVVFLCTHTTASAAMPNRGSLHTTLPLNVHADEARGSSSIPDKDGADATTVTTIVHGQDVVGHRVYATAASIQE